MKVVVVVTWWRGWGCCQWWLWWLWCWGLSLVVVGSCWWRCWRLVMWQHVSGCGGCSSWVPVVGWPMTNKVTWFWVWNELRITTRKSTKMASLDSSSHHPSSTCMAYTIVQGIFSCIKKLVLYLSVSSTVSNRPQNFEVEVYDLLLTREMCIHFIHLLFLLTVTKNSL